MTAALRYDAWLQSHVAAATDPADARIALECLAADRLDCSRAHLIAHPARILSHAEQRDLDALAARIAADEPLAYVRGEREFWSRSFRVSPAVLIPRPETEHLVEAAIDFVRKRVSASSTKTKSEVPAILELGTGSGCIAVTLALELGQPVTATDVSQDALEIAAANARLHDAPVDFLQGAWFNPVAAEYDLIVSNPPYVETALSRVGALAFEPAIALDGGADGLDAVRHIIKSAREYLRRDGCLMIEHGSGHADAITQLFSDHGYYAIETHTDLARLPRVTAACWTP